jgi:hypothetical protein
VKTPELRLSNNFLNRTLTAHQLRETTDKYHCIKLKDYCTENETVTRLKRQHTEREEKLCQLYI